MLRNRRGQNTLEYALIISVVIAALLTINTYLKRGVQGKLKESTDQIGKQFDPNKFTTASQAVSNGGETTTIERRNVATTGVAAKEGDTVSQSTTTEEITKAEYEKWEADTTKNGGSTDSGNAGGTEEVTPIIIEE